MCGVVSCADVAAKESKKEETVPVLQCVQNLMNEFLPRMQKGNAAEFRVALKVSSAALCAHLALRRLLCYLASPTRLRPLRR
jgi:hypothetical protein